MYGEVAYGESAYGEGAGASIVGGAVDGILAIVEAPDFFRAIGSTPNITISAVAEPPMYIYVVELQLAQLT